MDRALDVIGQPTSLEVVAVLTLVTIEDLIIQTNASRIVGSHLSSCECQRVYIGKPEN